MTSPSDSSPTPPPADNDATPSPTASSSVARRMGLATLLMAGSVLLSRVVGFVREIVIAAQQGATGATDAYYAAFTLPDMLNYMLAGGTLSITFIPLFSGYLARDEEAEGWRLFSILSTFIGILVCVAVVVGELIAPWAVATTKPGFNAEQLRMCVSMTRIILPTLFCFTLGGLLQATLLARERFAHVAAIPIVYNVSIIAGGLILGPWLGMEGFAWGTLAGAVLGPLVIPLWAARREVKYRFDLNLKHPGFAGYMKLALPLMLGVTLISLDEWILQYFGSDLDAGTVSWLNNARRLMLVPFAVIGQAASQAALPFLSRLWADNERDEMAQTLTRSLASVLFFAVLAAGAMVPLSAPIVFAAFQRGAFTPADAAGTAALLALFSVGIPAWSAQSLLARGFYAQKNTLEPMLIGSLVVALAVPVYYTLGARYGAPGLALASSIGVALNTSAFFAALHLRHLPLNLRTIGAALGRSLAAALPGASAAYLVLDRVALPHLDLTDTTQAILALILGAVAFAAIALPVAFVLDAPELDAFTQRIRRKLGR